VRRLSRPRAFAPRRSRVRAVAPSRAIVVRPSSIASHPSRVRVARVVVVVSVVVPVAARLPRAPARALDANASSRDHGAVLDARRARGVARVVERHERERRRMARSLDLDALDDAVRGERALDLARRRVEG